MRLHFAITITSSWIRRFSRDDERAGASSGLRAGRRPNDDRLDIRTLLVRQPRDL